MSARSPRRFVCAACDMELHENCLGHCVCGCHGGPGGAHHPH